MLKKSIFILLFLFCLSLKTHAQLCTGSLGDPIVEIDFGSGSNRGAALGAAITAFTYKSSGELDEGEYSIVNSSSGLKGNAWHVTTDHTGDSNGYMMVINSAVLANEGVFYTKTVSGLCPNTTYEFSAWLINIMNPSVGTDQYHPDVTFRISDTSGTILGSYNTGDISQTSSAYWRQYGFFFTVGSSSDVVISILNSAPSAHPGNDIALDDISFRPCGPTITTSIQNETSTNITICEGETVNYTFESSVSSGYSNPQYQWQLSDDNGTSWNDILGETATSYTFTDTSVPGTFLYRMAVGDGTNINSENCRINSDAFNIEITAKPGPLVGDAQQSFCTTQNATLSDIEIDATAIWYDTLSKNNVLPGTTPLVSGVTYYATQIKNACESDHVLAVTVTIHTPTLEIHDAEDFICDTLNDYEEEVDLTIYENVITPCIDCVFNYFISKTDAELFNEAGRIASPAGYNWSSNTSSIYVRIDSSDKCYQIAQIRIYLEETPVITLPDLVGVCEAENNTTIDAGFGFDSYLWSTNETTQTITVTSDHIGTNWVTVTQNHNSYTCSTTKEFKVELSNAAVISNIAIEDWTNHNNSITILLSENSLGIYEYSIDGINYQDSNTFTNLTSGEHTAFVRDKKGCGMTQEQVYILTYLKFFTPNGDGVNDTWSIKYSETEPKMTVRIFDRYGKLIKELTKNKSWDGTINGYNLPTNDYWFVVTRENGDVHKGHFTLKR